MTLFYEEEGNVLLPRQTRHEAEYQPQWEDGLIFVVVFFFTFETRDHV